MKYTAIVSQILTGKSIGRAFFNASLMSMPKVKGRILDLGSGRYRPSYYRFLKMEPNAKFITVNISREYNPDIIADLEESFPFKDASIDSIFAFNILEHLFNFKNFIMECNRVLRVNGKIIIFVPFLQKIHSDPHDYFRYTHSALYRLLIMHGFREVRVVPIGLGPFTAAISLIDGLFSNMVLRIFLLYFLGVAYVLDKIINRLSQRYYTFKNYPLGYFCIGKKAKH
jgi:SAM-dependent methyltransferase